MLPAPADTTPGDDRRRSTIASTICWPAFGRRRRSTQIDACRQDVGGVVTRVDVDERDEAAHEKRRADEQHDAHGRLGRQQQVRTRSPPPALR